MPVQCRDVPHRPYGVCDRAVQSQCGFKIAGLGVKGNAMWDWTVAVRFPTNSM